MQFVLSRGVRVEEIGGETIVLDRSGAVVHHISGDRAEALSLVCRGIDDAAVPARLEAAMAELIDSGVVKASDWSRRRLLKAGGGSLAGAALITVALASPAAAASGSVTVGLFKSVAGNNEEPLLASLCLTGATANARRGSCAFTRTEGAVPTISVTITISSGPTNVNRGVYILQSTATECVGGISTPAGTWAASPANGPQTFSASIVNSATRFVVSLQQSGGGGTDSSTSAVALLP